MKHGWLYALLIATISTVITLAAGNSPTIKEADLGGLDLLFTLYSDPAKADRRIVLVEVDQKSVDFFEKDNIPFPWPRSMYNPVIEYINAGGAKAVIIDILFSSESPYGVADDKTFADTMKNANNVYLASSFLEAKGAFDYKLPDRFTLPYKNRAPEALITHSVKTPLPVFLDSAKGIGNVISPPDSDGVYRRVRPYVVYNNKLAPSLATAPLMESGNTISLNDPNFRLDDEGFMWLNYHGPRGTYKRYSLAKVIASYQLEMEGGKLLIPKNIFAGKYVIVSYSAVGLYDLKPTPLSHKSPGAEIHATALDNVLNGDSLIPSPRFYAIVIGFIVAFAISGTVLTSGSMFAAFVALGASAVIFAIVSLFFFSGFYISVFTLSAPSFLALTGSAIYRYGVEGKKRRTLQQAFGRYLSPKVVAKIAADPDALSLGGERKVLTIFFCDLTGFTALSEQLKPEKLVKVLNDYTAMVSDTIFDLDGTVDKYIGDAVMAFWGAPVSNPDHAKLAVKAALTCVEKLSDLNKRLAEQAIPLLDLRIGLNSGECVVGNIGSSKRFDYTAIGDAVNEASRLEGLNRYYGTEILVSEATLIVADEELFFTRKVDYLSVKGKQKHIWAYQVMAETGSETIWEQRVKERYETALKLYLDRKWDEAADILTALLEEGYDGPSINLARRVALYRANPPPDDWDGAFVHTSK